MAIISKLIETSNPLYNKKANNSSRYPLKPKVRWHTIARVHITATICRLICTSSHEDGASTYILSSFKSVDTPMDHMLSCLFHKFRGICIIASIDLYGFTASSSTQLSLNVATGAHRRSGGLGIR